MIKPSGIIRKLEKEVLNASPNAKINIATGFGKYLVDGKLVPMTPELLLSSTFNIRHATIYNTLPGNYHGSRMTSNFFADPQGIKRLQAVISKYRGHYS